jgi:hypothetical protein
MLPSIDTRVAASPPTEPVRPFCDASMDDLTLNRRIGWTVGCTVGRMRCADTRRTRRAADGSRAAR